MENRKQEDFVNVSVRIKPIFNGNEEEATSSSSCLQVVNKQPPVLLVLDKAQSYNFDNIFTNENSQKDIYCATVKPLVENVKAGFNCTVFAYGQTGTGKTYTMGTNPNVICEEDSGLIPRTLEDFFYRTNNDQEIEIFISFVEIYNEKVFDLLSDNNKIPLSVKGFTIHGFQKIKVNNSYDALSLLTLGGKNRHTSETKQNLNSSRSHAIFTIYCHKRNSMEETKAKLNLVDLAGSESVRKTGNQGSSFHEGININKGLLSLGQVMTALSNNSSHIPYRQSIITTILQDSLNKKNFVSLIACVSPNEDDLGETLQTLEFSYRVKKIKNKPEINQLIAQYKKDNLPLFTNCFSKGLTPSKRAHTELYKTPYKNSKTFMPLPAVQEPNNFPSTESLNSESPKSLLNLSMQSVKNDVIQQNLSPVIKKYINAMENSLMTKLENVIKNTVHRPSRVSTCKIDGENPTTPSFSWEKVAKIVRSEIFQFTVKASKATSSPIETNTLRESPKMIKPRKLLDYESYDSSVSENPAEMTINNNDDVFRVPKPKEKSTKMSKASIARRSSIRLQTKNRASILPVVENEGKRRSVRLQIKKKSTDDTLGDITIDLSRSETKRNTKETNYRLTMDSSCFQYGHPKTAKLKNKFSSADSPITNRNKQVLHILNHGSLKEIEKLHTVGPKTAEKIYFFRQLKGQFQSISDLSEMPHWSKNKYNKFLSENFLRVD